MREEDLAALADTLGGTPDAIEARLHELIGVPRHKAARLRAMILPPRSLPPTTSSAAPLPDLRAVPRRRRSRRSTPGPCRHAGAGVRFRDGDHDRRRPGRDQPVLQCATYSTTRSRARRRSSRWRQRAARLDARRAAGPVSPAAAAPPAPARAGLRPVRTADGHADQTVARRRRGAPLGADAAAMPTPPPRARPRCRPSTPSRPRTPRSRHPHPRQRRSTPPPSTPPRSMPARSCRRVRGRGDRARRARPVRGRPVRRRRSRAARA